MNMIGPYSIDDYIHLIKSFHGNLAPGLIIGGFMVDMARAGLPEEVLFDAISETGTCLPDAIQLLTPCTIGNGWLRIMNFGRYALSLYDKYEGTGVWVFMDSKKVEDWSEIRDWFFKIKPRKEQDVVKLRDQIIEAGTEILSLQKIVIDQSFLGKKGKGAIGKCPSCTEAYPIKDGPTCLACQGGSPYKSQISEDNAQDRPVLKVVPGDKGSDGSRLLDRLLPKTGKD